MKFPRYTGIRAYVGPMGSGKTYLMARDGVKALREGREVWANAGFGIKDAKSGRASRTYVSLSEMLLAPPGTVLLLDEVGTFMSARRWQELPRAMMYRLTQARKDSLSLIWSAQHEMQADAALRRLTAVVMHVKRWGRYGVTVAMPPVDYRKGDERPMGRSTWMLRQSVMDSFDTHARVWVPPEVVEEIETETSQWRPLTDDVMAALRDRVVAARAELPEDSREDPEGGPRRDPLGPGGGPGAWESRGTNGRVRR